MKKEPQQPFQRAGGPPSKGDRRPKDATLAKPSKAERVTLRPVTTGDEAFLYRVYAGTRADEMALLNWDETQKEAFLRMQFDAQHRHYRQHFSSADYQIILGAGNPIGRLYVDRRPDEIRVIDIALLPEARGAGIGGALMSEILAEATRAGKLVRIHVERNNPALRLYHRLGFTEVEDQGVYWLMEWKPASPQAKGTGEST